MPKIEERLLTPSNKRDFPLVDADIKQASALGVPSPISTQLSPSGKGNPSPNRGLVPPEFMYDFDINAYSPSSPYFVRRNVDVNAIIRNTALQAFKGKV